MYVINYNYIDSKYRCGGIIIISLQSQLYLIMNKISIKIFTKSLRKFSFELECAYIFHFLLYNVMQGSASLICAVCLEFVPKVSYHNLASPIRVKQHLLTFWSSGKLCVSIQSLVLRRCSSVSSSGFPENSGLK